MFRNPIRINAYIKVQKYVPMGLMVNDKNGDCLGFKTPPAAQHHGAHFKANCT